MAKHNEAVTKVTDIFTKLANQVETLLDNVVSERGDRITKSSLAKTVTDLNDCNPMLAMAVVDTYLSQRSDLQSARGPGGGVGAKQPERKPRSISDTAKLIQSAAGEILDMVKPEDRFKTRDLVAKVAAKVKMDEADCKNNVNKLLHSRKDIKLIKGRFGGLRKIESAQATAAHTATG